MCGIWALLSQVPIDKLGFLCDAFMKTKGRGPEYSSFDLINQYILLGFHRLAIMDLSADGNQPFHHVREDGSCVYCVCNGEIYPHEQIKKEYGIVTKSHSDCEVIIPLYEKLGVDGMIRLLGSEFAFVIFDINKDGKVKMISGRDPIGNRPAFYGIDGKSLCVSSEMKSLSDIYDKVYVFPPGHYMVYEDGQMTLTPYYSYDYKQLSPIPPIEEIYAEIRKRFINCVRKRLMTDRPFGALLSGGLDSSLVVAVAKMLLPDKKFPVYTIAFTTGSTDLPFAKKVAKYCDLDHYVIEVDPMDALKELDETIYAIESFDITTVRASTVQRIIAKYIEKNTKVKVIFVGENSDELFQGYKYYHNQPSAYDGHIDSIVRVHDVHMFDGLRTDRTMAHHGLEVRLPFADPELIDYVFTLPPELVKPQGGFEKTLLRDAFKELKILPEEVLYRSKEALSDAVSTVQKSWFQYIQEHIETIVSDEEFISQKDKFKHCTPFTKESYYYRKKFVEYFGDSENIAHTIPYFWMPKWSPETKDPSARTLKVYKEHNK
ncbi:asparagine synthetase glutamine-hydrolyzing [Fadolivirus algeromassiliense]|jgi:asparagine synthase (glutamine-hydrolysing)|uniref:asparagine synthase (glutamine-hydrolyzing) n=1 Tax=Fadolivirus FV1/VV64 TaxID=3070911 RepID=A0A7D3UVF4_9VIRU|nr:asparagine synthetase glutamine-hydrolyzing [Fadolivirus algeromassiliense]QKF93994.1 asparagine synthetase glutamine-hydrolyzing [Fadolivirus FV1/VV64]